MDFDSFVHLIQAAVSGETVIEHPEQTLQADLGWDSFQLLVAIVWVEEATGHVMPEELIGTVETIGHLYGLHQSYSAQKGAMP